jgi:hypothetical protein
MACPSPGITLVIVGAVGTVNGTTVMEFEASELPVVFVATTDTKYDVPFFRPDTVPYKIVGSAIFVKVVFVPTFVSIV